MYAGLLSEVKARVRHGQMRAALAANRELLHLYWDIGRLIAARQSTEGWGARVIPRLARDLEAELPGLKGFSARNLGRMVRFFQEYQEVEDDFLILPQPVAKLAAQPPDPSARVHAAWSQAMASLPWGHHVLLIERVAESTVRQWYAAEAVREGWSRDTLAQMLKSNAHLRSGAAVTNFTNTLPEGQSALAQQTLKDPYVFDFLALTTPFRERELELSLLAHLEQFLVELGVGFAFVGRQRRLTLGDEEYILDLLFYHLRLRCFVVVELKVGAFTPEHAGKMNFYLNLVDDTLRHPDDKPSIGLILCQEKDRLVAEYALRGLDKPIGVSEYELTRALPATLLSALPSIDAIEAELAQGAVGAAKDVRQDDDGGSER
jgi:predicted nuclease of restriction endonuclease-like (RecB) superfamily